MVCISTHTHIARHGTAHKKPFRRRVSEQKNWIRMSAAASTLWLSDQFKRIVNLCVCGCVAHATHCHTIKIEYTLLIFSRIHLYLNGTVPAPQRTILSYIHFSRFLFSLILRMQIQLNHFFFINAISLPFLSLWSLTGKSRKKIEQNRIELNFTEGISVFYPLWENSMKKKIKNRFKQFATVFKSAHP